MGCEKVVQSIAQPRSLESIVTRCVWFVVVKYMQQNYGNSAEISRTPTHSGDVIGSPKSELIRLP